MFNVFIRGVQKYLNMWRESIIIFSAEILFTQTVLGLCCRAVVLWATRTLQSRGLQPFMIFTKSLLAFHGCELWQCVMSEPGVFFLVTETWISLISAIMWFTDMISDYSSTPDVFIITKWGTQAPYTNTSMYAGLMFCIEWCWWITKHLSAGLLQTFNTEDFW